MQQSRRPWTIDEDNAVRKIIEEIGTKNWPLVSIKIKQNFNIEGRSGKQCRERWHNQLNPEVNKMPWTEQEQRLLFEAHKTYRNKWIEISKLFQGRTDNSIKNHFYSTIRRSLRRICKILGNKNSTSELRNIKPSILSKIFQYSQFKGDQITKQNELIVQQSKIIAEELLNFARTKSSKSFILDDFKRKSLQYLISKLNEFSLSYNDQKDLLRENLKNTVVDIKTTLKYDYVQKLSQTEENISRIEETSPSKSNTGIYDWQEFQNRCRFVKLFMEQMQNENQKGKKGKKMNKNI